MCLWLRLRQLSVRWVERYLTGFVLNGLLGLDLIIPLAEVSFAFNFFMQCSSIGFKLMMSSSL